MASWRATLSLCLLLLAVQVDFSLASPPVSILSFGAVANNNSLAAATANALALKQAFAHVATQQPPRIVVIPGRLEFYSYNTTLYSLQDAELRIEGTWTVVDDHKGWPRVDASDPDSKSTNLIDVRAGDDEEHDLSIHPLSLSSSSSSGDRLSFVVVVLSLAPLSVDERFLFFSASRSSLLW